ncbi:3104_t:CDS:10 [Ambispora leptoticha]|uniref:3104_t:CDS:1 n=1 Tax=Ambispora leptoticha TaxID=144679 RepID=A0A9N8WBN2_9GLOM|nr:3104_t:CDS:10 [Ambispora leptoticha]
MSRNNLRPHTWEILGPFPIGTREIGFGADPLEAYGGFANLKYSTTETYPSELADNGVVGWSMISENEDGSVGPFNFPNVRWNFNQQPLGWAINQFQIWARGKFNVPSDSFSDSPDTTTRMDTTTIKFQCYNITEFYIDDIRFYGDFYNYKNQWHISHLTPGTHTIRVRVVNEIRIFGGKVPPTVRFSVDIYQSKDSFLILENEGVYTSVIVPDIVDGMLAGEVMSIPILNAGNLWGYVDKVEALMPEGSDFETAKNTKLFEARLDKGSNSDTKKDTFFRIAPSQQRNLKIYLKLADNNQSQNDISFQLKFGIMLENNTYITLNSNTITIISRKFGEPFKFTFEDFDGTVQYAIAIPPLELITTGTCPLLLALHGAGVETEMSFWKNAIKRQTKAWVLLPSGRTPWGYDWHGPSRTNVFTSIESLKYLPFVNIQDFSPIVLAGHSNGGQGTWHFLTHFPDSFIAAVPVAGFTKIQRYVPYYWNSEAHIDPILQAASILESSIAENNNDLYASNLTGIPILARTGSEDDNVPPIHSRSLVRLVNEHSHNNSAIKLLEDLGKGHWFDDALSDAKIQPFFDKHLYQKNENEGGTNETEFYRQFSKGLFSQKKEFTLTLINPAGCGTKGGVKIEQLETPYRLARFTMFLDKPSDPNKLFDFRTTNISRFTVNKVNRQGNLKLQKVLYSKKENGTWEITNDNESWKKTQRHSDNYGPAIQVLESPGPLLIIIGNQFKDKLSSIYYKEYAEIITSGQVPNGNLVLLGGPDINYATKNLLDKRPSSVTFDTESFTIAKRKFYEKNTGILFLHPPIAKPHLALIIAGTDEVGFENAAKLFPKITGVPVPDWIIVGPEVKWKGVGGLLGAGFWNNQWKFNPSTGYLL